VSLRSVTERALRGMTLKRRLPREFGRAPIWVSPGAGLRYLFRGMRNIDPKLLALVEEHVRPGHVVWDIGANVGLFAIAAAQRVGQGGRVFAFEPDAWLVQLLRRTAAIQPATAAAVAVLPVAVANSVDIREFFIAMRSRARNFLAGYGSSQTGGARESQLVIAVTMDWLGARLPKPDVVKIDVEGAEWEVLEGARELIARCRPLIICEVGEPRSKDVAQFLLGQDYQLYDGDLPAAARRPLALAPWNTLAIPKPR